MLLRLHLSEYTEVAARNSVRTAKLSLQLYFRFKCQRAKQIVSNAEPNWKEINCEESYQHVFPEGGLDHLLPKFEHIFVAVITFFPLSSVQILLLPACCLLCVL